MAIARALVSRPAIVLADEPTGNLDSQNGAAIMELLRRSCDGLHQTIVMVNHDPHAAAYADRVVFLRDGLVAHEARFDAAAGLEQRHRRIIEMAENLPAAPPALMPRSLPLALRSLIARPLQTLLTTFGIVLGVAVILSINVTNLSTLNAITRLFSESSGKASLIVINADLGARLWGRPA